MFRPLYPEIFRDSCLCMAKSKNTTFCLDAGAADAHFPGIGRYIADLCAVLPPLLHNDERLVVIRNPDAHRLHRLPEPDDFTQAVRGRLEYINLALGPFSRQRRRILPDIVRECGADMLHCPYLLMPSRPGLPTLLTVHDLIPLILPRHSGLKARLFFKHALKSALKASDMVITISDSTRNDLLRLMDTDPDSVRTVHSMVSPHFVPASQERIAEVRRRHSLPQRYALYLGSNKPHKNTPFLIRVWNRIQIKDMSLVVAGAVDTRRLPKFEDAGTNGSVFLQFFPDSDLPALLSGAEIFIFPSLYEGFGLPVLEALACGTAVACSKTASLPEVAAEAAVYFNPHNVEETTTVLTELMNDQKRLENLRSKGPARAAQFTPERTGLGTLELYRKLAYSDTD